MQSRTLIMRDEALLELRDIVAAPPPSWWPPAPGWWILALMVLLISLFLAKPLLHYQRRRQRQRSVLSLLKTLRKIHRNNKNNAVFAAEVSMLLRRVALERFPHEQVAGLNGAAWLKFLDKTIDGVLSSQNTELKNTKARKSERQFSSGAGQTLADAPYQRQATINVDELYRLARRWLRHNL